MERWLRIPNVSQREALAKKADLATGIGGLGLIRHGPRSTAPESDAAAVPMAFIVWLITVSALTLLLAWRMGRLRSSRLPAWTRSGSLAPVLRDGDLGLAQVALPSGWRAASGLHDTAGIQAIAPLRRRYVIVISEHRADFEPGFTLEQHAEMTLAALGESVRMVWRNGPHRRTVGPYESLQFEIEGYCEQTALTYLHTTVAGHRAFHQVLAWSTRSSYDRRAFDALLDGFSELPSDGSDLTQLPLIIHSPSSRYSVH